MKPFHVTGEVRKEEYLHRLNQNDQFYLEILSQHMQSIAGLLKTDVHILAVGSSADFQSNYGDIDLLICPEIRNVRSEFATLAYHRFSDDKRIVTLQEYPKGSAKPSHSQNAPFKLFIFAAITMKTPGEFNVFDMTFLGEDGGSYQDILAFHRQNNLAFSIVD
jgi:hypothetical protein